MYVGGLGESTLMKAAMDNDDVGPAAANDDNDADAAVDLRSSVSTPSHNTMPSTSYCKTLAEAQHLERSLTQFKLEIDDTMDITTDDDYGQMLYFIYVV